VVAFFFYEPSSKRRKGFPSETDVKRGFPRHAWGQRVELSRFERDCSAAFRPWMLTKMRLSC